MFKRAFLVATTFGVLVACYATYVRVFALVAGSLARARPTYTVSFEHTEAESSKRATSLALDCFGEEHWAASPDLPFRIYDAERGLWMYFQNYERLNDGKRFKFWPFAIIWGSRDGRSLKTATSESAIVDLDQPVGLAGKTGPPGGRMKVVHAKLEGEVRLRDDKGTPRDATDDLNIGPLTYVEYDEPKLQITGDPTNVVVIDDRGAHVTGIGLLIQLRARADGNPNATTGFNGVESAYLLRSVHILMDDVGQGGFLSGASSRPAVSPTDPRPGGPAPLDLRADGDGTVNRPAMRIDLARPRTPVEVGPPSPPGPTFAHFHRNVEVLHGKSNAARDQLNSDELHLTLVPGDKPPPRDRTPRTANNAANPDGSMSNLALKRADASGHNVFLISAAQGVRVRCNELIHKKQFPDAPDETYFRGDRTTPLSVEKLDIAQDGPSKGQVTSYSRIVTTDATIFDEGRGAENATIVARGPGQLWLHPAPDKPFERTAKWEDQLTLKPESLPGAPINSATARKQIILTGSPSFNDIPSKSSLSARRTLVVWLRPKAGQAVPATAKQKPAQGAAGPAGGQFEIDKLVALADVHLTAPGKTLVARDRLDAVFENVPAAATPAGAPAPSVAAVAVTSPVTQEVVPREKPTRPAADAPRDPEARAVANNVWAKILLRPGMGKNLKPPAAGAASGLGLGMGNGNGNGDGQAEIDKVYLRGAVTFHQDPSREKTRGTDVVGEAVDVFSPGQNNMRLVVFHKLPPEDGKPATTTRVVQPTSAKVADRASSAENPPASRADRSSPYRRLTPAEEASLARVDTDSVAIRGEVIGLDQKSNQAWVEGRGAITHLASRGLLTDKGLTNPPDGEKPRETKPVAGRGAPAPAAPVKMVPITIRFTKGMTFFGHSTNLRGRPAARAEFYENVHAESDEATLECGEVMRTYLDRTIDLIRPAPGNQAKTSNEPRADLAMIECVKDVVIVNQKVDPDSGDVLQKQRIVAEYVVYDKATGSFKIPDQGEVFLWERQGQNQSLLPGAPGGRVIRPAAAAGDAPRPIRRAPAVVGNNHNPLDLSRDTQKEKAKEKGRNQALKDKKKGKALPLVLTWINFNNGMVGRFGTGKDADKSEPRWADFFGDVEVLHGPVLTANTPLDPDRLPAGSQFMTAQVLRVVSEPNAANPDAPPRYLLRAWDRAQASTDDKTIQADTITYDSLEDKFYAYGEDGRDIFIAQQTQAGQTPLGSRSGAVMYNHKTGEVKVTEPKYFSIINMKTGERPKPAKPELDPNKPRNTPRSKFRNLRNNIERRGYTGM